MKRITFFSLALVAGFCFQPMPLFAQDQDTGKPDTKDADAAAPAAKEKPKATEQVQKGNQQTGVPRSDKADSKITTEKAAGDDRSMEFTKPDSKITTEKAAGDDRSTEITKPDTKVTEQSDKQTSQSQSQQKQSASIVVQGTQANHYNNQWVAASTHGDWDISVNHNWNNHEYRYYDGGWLIITTSESPGYYQSGALVIRVKQSLAQQGYYNGHLTGTVGPHTRLAISNYESANGLPVNGQIDGPLLASLGLE